MTTAMPQDVTVVWVDAVGSDWLGIYLDGDRIYEGHPPSDTEVLGLLGIAYAERTVDADTLRVPGVRGLPLTLPRATQ